jgi:hypothetical protein
MLDMLTADAAAKHRHDFSPPPGPPNDSVGNGSLFMQMPLSILGSVLRKQAASSPAPSNASPDAAQSSNPTPNSAASPKNPMTTHPDTPAASPTPSRPASSSSIASTEGKPKKRGSRPKTTYNLAQPPPITGTRHKLHIRPKVLLQLHQVIPSKRPKPVYEVIPFSLLAPRSTRRLARTFNSKDKLCPTDLLIVKAAEYGNKDEDEKSDDERWGTRDVIGIICPSKKGDKDPSDRTELLLDDGSSWEVTNMPNGGYEFSFTDDHGLNLKRRWIPKSAHARRVSTMSNSSQALGSPVLPDEKKFNFSTISASSRRHPVIASLSRTSIDVLESYTMPSATSPPTPSLPSLDLSTPLPTPASITEPTSFLDKDRLPVKTDDALRRFIVLSGIWVAFSENWSPAYSWSRNIPTAYPLSINSTNPRPAANRTVSMSFIDSPRSTSPASTIDENRRTPRKLWRTGTQKLHSSASFSKFSSASSPKTPAPASPVKTRSRRSNSTGNADLDLRKNGSTRKRFGLGLEDQTLEETEEERQSKRSMELLRVRELSVPDVSDKPSGSLAPIQIIEPPREDRSPSPASPDPRARKTRSAYDPITTAGLWDSGVTEKPGLKSRPTSLVVMKEKEKKKQQRSKSKEKNKDNDKGVARPRASERFKQRFMGIFRREKQEKL